MALAKAWPDLAQKFALIYDWCLLKDSSKQIQSGANKFF